MYTKLKITLKGNGPMLMHNGDLANPMNSTAKAMKKISSKRKKVDADYEELAKLEFFGGLYLNKERQVVLPAYLLKAVIVNGAKKHREGPAAKPGLFVVGNPRLQYDGPQDVDGLWENESFRDQRMVAIQRNKILRTRPIFEDWSVEFEVEINPDLVQSEMVARWIESAGFECGIGDCRPEFGRFTATVS